MLGQVVYQRDGKGTKVVRAPLHGVPVLRVALDPEGFWARRRAGRAARGLVRQGAARVLVPEDFPFWEELSRAGLRPVDPLPLLRSCAAPMALALLRRQGEDPLRAAVALRGSRAERDLVRAAEEQLGPLDALVCNAGVALPQQLLTDTTDEQWRQVMGVDLDGVFYTLRAAVPGFVRRQRGAIVTVSSMWGVTGGSCEVAYSAAKAGVIGLTKALAKELGPSHITVNCVAPGVIDTEMNGGLGSEALAALAEETPLGRIGTAEEVAESVWFLAGGGAPFLTGQVIQPNGGIVI